MSRIEDTTVHCNSTSERYGGWGGGPVFPPDMLESQILVSHAQYFEKVSLLSL